MGTKVWVKQELNNSPKKTKLKTLSGKTLVGKKVKWRLVSVDNSEEEPEQIHMQN